MDLSNSAGESGKESFSIYYNSDDELTIDKYNNREYIWALYSLSGQILAEGTAQSQETIISHPNFAQGVYLLRLNDGETYYQEKVLIK